jgi:hypothetical protein
VKCRKNKRKMLCAVNICRVVWRSIVEGKGKEEGEEAEEAEQGGKGERKKE